MKTCCTCRTEKPISDFHKDSSRKDGLHPRCKSCVAAYWKKRTIASGTLTAEQIESRRLAQQRYRILKRYGISLEFYNELLGYHDGGCAICHTTQGNDAFIVDRTDDGRISGLLCRRCNDGLKHFKRDERLILTMLDYLNIPDDLP